ncbi:hypothetical protein XELAEV_18019978mg [Xenopus laevis]|uniref:Uncharacterized protein n=1 Tax=Xenopus laevis TaxID=8355 RepID=A0A974D8I8_XENLA|nr:hypothetical protein XELAEV_18019978mg [Xenopus laevis]
MGTPDLTHLTMYINKQQPVTSGLRPATLGWLVNGFPKQQTTSFLGYTSRFWAPKMTPYRIVPQTSQFPPSSHLL